MKINYKHFALLPLLLLGACGNAIHGSGQVVEINPTPLPPGVRAHCVASNEASAVQLPNAPGSISVERSWTSLNITCRSTDGNLVGRTTISSDPSPWSIGGNAVAAGGTAAVFAVPGEVQTKAATLFRLGTTAGLNNVAMASSAGVLVSGIALDLVTGSAWRYQDKVDVHMRPVSYAPTSVADASVGPIVRAPEAAPAPRRVSRPARTARPTTNTSSAAMK